MRENTAYIRPPRALWVPFDLGRPLGTPNDAAFQTGVLRSALALLERSDGPVILEDYPHDAPDQGQPENMEGLVCPVPLRKPAQASSSSLMQAVNDEVAQLAPWFERFRAEHKRTTVGVGKLLVPEAVAFIGDILVHGKSERVAQDAWPSALRFACEDLRNYYLEAAAMRPGGSASRSELVDWFWGNTAAGQLLLALHPVCAAHPHAPLQTVAIVPRAQEHRLKAKA